MKTQTNVATLDLSRMAALRLLQRDPIALFEEHLADGGVARAALEAIEAEVEAEIEHAEAEAMESRRNHMPAPESALVGVYADRRDT